MPAPRPPHAFTLGEDDLGLATDLYELTMAAVYHRRRPLPRASFELSVRRLPPQRNFLVLAGIEQALAALTRLRFTAGQISYLRSLPPFAGVDDGFFATLADFRFRGEVWAMPEGSVFFPGEPVLRVTGTLLEAQIVETLLLSVINFQTAVASKAARVRLAAGERAQLAEFGGRRAHGPQAAAWAARAAFLGGFDATSNLFAGQQMGIPVVGTMAHSFVMSFPSEGEAFEEYRRVFPRHTTLLVDTYDTLEGVRRALELDGDFAGIRLDSGDLGALAREARSMLDAAGRQAVRIFASGDLDEHRIAHLLGAGAPIDAFGVGTRLATSADAPFIGGVYKLIEIEIDGEPVPRFKTSAGKATRPGRKQVLRRSAAGRMLGDRVVMLATGPGGAVARGSGPALRKGEEALLRPAMLQGEPLPLGSLEESRARVLRQLTELPQELRGLQIAAEPYAVEIAPDPGGAR